MLLLESNQTSAIFGSLLAVFAGSLTAIIAATKRRRAQSEQATALIPPSPGEHRP